MNASVQRLGWLVRQRREDRGWSQQTLADSVGASRDMVKRLELGSGNVRLGVVLSVLTALEPTGHDLRKVLYGQIAAKR